MFGNTLKYEGRAKPPVFYAGGIVSPGGAGVNGGFEVEVPGTIAGVWIAHLGMESGIWVFGVDDAPVLTANLAVITPPSEVGGPLRSTFRQGTMVGTPPNSPRGGNTVGGTSAGQAGIPIPYWCPGGRRFYCVHNTANVFIGWGVYGWEEDL